MSNLGKYANFTADSSALKVEQKVMRAMTVTYHLSFNLGIRSLHAECLCKRVIQAYSHFHNKETV